MPAVDEGRVLMPDGTVSWCAGLIAVGANFVGFYIQRFCVINLWAVPRKIPIDAKATRFAFSIVSCLCLLTATLEYFYLWVYISTNSLTAPICKIPILYLNATMGYSCTFDAYTGTTGTTDCAPYLETACKGRNIGDQAIAMFADQTPALIIADRVYAFAGILSTPLLAWGAAVILFVRYRVQVSSVFSLLWCGTCCAPPVLSAMFAKSTCL